MSQGQVVVRVAPSPTGPPHVGTAYIALFNLALRRSRGGRILLRVEDTDRARSTRASEEQIYEALDWLGLRFDESPRLGGPSAPYRQSERTDLYRRCADELLASGAAYRCFCTPGELEEVRRAQREKGLSYGYDGRCARRGPGEVERLLAEGRPHVVRLAVDHAGETRVRDFLRGEIVIAHGQVDDQVLLKSDGYPTYHLANVVDDHFMGVTHVIRAEEWISSLPKHVLLYRAFGWPEPVFAHMPLLRNRDRSKISKRRNPTSLLWYRDAGYLPEAMVNFLALLGYSPPARPRAEGENPELFSLDEMVRDFSLERVKTSGPVFDLEKLDSFNGAYLRAMSRPACARRLLAFVEDLLDRRQALEAAAAEPLPKAGDLREREERRRRGLAATIGLFSAHRPDAAAVERMLEVLQERMVTFYDFAEKAAFFFEEDLSYDAALLVQKKATPGGVASALEEAARRLEGLDPFDRASIEGCVRSLPGDTGLKVKPLFMALRVALTGSKVSPPLFESMEILGRERTVERLRSGARRIAGTARA